MSSSVLENFLSQEFTHIIVGGGTAGLLVAARLSESPNIRVGIIEAGSAAYDDPRITVPGRLGETLGSEHDWQFETTKQPGLGGRRLPFPRGRVLGGTSALNFMTWNRGCKEDYDAWEELGNEGWGWEGILPFWKRVENFTEPTAEHQKANSSLCDPSYHGKGGPLHCTYSETYSASHTHWQKTLNKLGVKTNASHFSGSNVGCWTSVNTITPDKKERCYSATACYQPYSGRENMTLLTEAMAQEVILEQEDGRRVTKGVRFTRGGKEHVVKTSGEVIVCGGSVSSPQLLELSGVGNPRILNAGGIKCKVDSPCVGENFQDHIMTTLIVELDPSVVTPADLRADPVQAAAADEQYMLERTGLRTATPSSVAYLPFSHIIPTSDLQKWGKELLSSSSSEHKLRDRILAERLTTDKGLGQIEFNFDVSMYSPYFKAEPGKKYGTMMMMLQYPFSTGSMHIPPTPEGKDRVTVEDKPVIDPNFYLGRGGDIDFKTVALCERFADKICRTEPLSSIILQRAFPPEKDRKDTETEDHSDWVRDTTISDWHPVGTCAMGGHEGIKGGVVDARLRVYGVEGLRVCDASIMPLQVAAHLQATVYAIGEKGAEMIKEDWEARGNGGKVKGVNGMNGMTGVSGENGMNGTNGINGINGINGNNAAEGVRA